MDKSSIKFGLRISPIQRQYLVRAKRQRTARELIEPMMSVLHDPDIRSGKEDLHPDWTALFDTHIEKIKQQLPVELFTKIYTVFSALPVDTKSVSKINPSGARLVFLLGAGASKPDPSGIPTVKELLPDLLARAKRLDKDEVTKLAEFCESSDIMNIEDLLTAAHIAEFCGRSPTVFKLLEFLLLRDENIEELPFRRRASPKIDVSSIAFLQDTLQVLFGLLSSRMLPAKPNKAHEAIASYVQTHGNTPIITTNYDCCMDLALLDNHVPLSYLIEFAKPDTGASNQQLAQLIKLHGSLNWFYCETCQEVQWVDIQKMLADCLEGRISYPVIGVCLRCGGPKRGLLVPPLAMKFDAAPPLNPLLNHAATAFETADVIVVVGFSFADADLYISRMVSKAMQKKSKMKMIMLDPDWSVSARIRRKFSARIPNFDEMRIIELRGDCTETLPSFLKGEYYRVDEAKNKKGASPLTGHDVTSVDVGASAH